MIEVKTYDAEGNEATAVQVDEVWFGGRVRAELLRRAVLMYEANRRSGTASTRRRGELAGSTRKLYRQKNTGRARVGDRGAPHRRGGGSVFGPKPRDYSWSLPKKALKAALNSALLAKLADGEVFVAECATPDEPKTRQVSEYMEKIGIAKGTTCLYVTGDYDNVFYKSARNIPGLAVLPLAEINTYAVIKPSRVVFSRPAFDKLLEQRQ
jgi:large subunit ribosomal protein L4